jgi:hypothetical protein
LHKRFPRFSQLKSISQNATVEILIFYKLLYIMHLILQRRLEDSLAKVRSDYDTQMSQVQAASIEQQNKLESEMEARHGLQSEVSYSTKP